MASRLRHIAEAAACEFLGEPEAGEGRRDLC